MALALLAPTPAESITPRSMQRGDRRWKTRSSPEARGGRVRTAAPLQPATVEPIPDNVQVFPARREIRAVLQWSERSERNRKHSCYVPLLPRRVGARLLHGTIVDDHLHGCSTAYPSSKPVQ